MKRNENNHQMHKEEIHGYIYRMSCLTQRSLVHCCRSTIWQEIPVFNGMQNLIRHVSTVFANNHWTALSCGTYFSVEYILLALK